MKKEFGQGSPFAFAGSLAKEKTKKKGVLWLIIVKRKGKHPCVRKNGKKKLTK